MAKIIDLLTKEAGKGINHFRYGYAESPTAMLTIFDLSDLNQSTFDFKKARLKKVPNMATQFSDEKKVVWYEDSIKEVDFTATEAAAAADLTFTVSIDTLQIGDTLMNRASGEKMLVTAVTGNTITVDANASGVGNGDSFMRYGSARKYGADHARTPTFNDYSTLDNYMQFVGSEIPEDKTDVLTNNLNRMFYKDVKDYLAELYAECSRNIIRTMVYSMYVGKKGTTTVGGKTIYRAGGLDEFIPSAYKDQNIKGATDKATITNIRTQLTKAYQSGVAGLNKKGRMVLFVNTAMNAVIDDLFIDKISQLPNNLEQFGINVRTLNLSGYKIDIVEDYILNEIFGSTAKAYLVDLEGVVMQNLSKDVIGTDGKTTDMAAVSKIWIPNQSNPDTRRVQLLSHFTYIFTGITSGCFQSWLYA